MGKCFSKEEADSRPLLGKNKEYQKTEKELCSNFTNTQLAALERQFKITSYPDIYDVERLAERLQMRESRVRAWFITRRIVEKRRMGEEDEEMDYEEEGEGGEAMETEELIEMDERPGSLSSNEIYQLCPQLTRQQLDVLEKEFDRRRFPDVFERERLAESLELTEATVRTWFITRRAMGDWEMDVDDGDNGSDMECEEASEEDVPDFLDSGIMFPETLLDSATLNFHLSFYLVNQQWTTLTHHQLEIMEKKFEETQYPWNLNKLASKTQLPKKAVGNWFVMRREQWRRWNLSHV